MSVELSLLKSQLKGYIQQVNSRPTDAQYEQAVRTAVTAFNSKFAAVDRASLSVVSGTAAYSLPADFLGLIKVEPIGIDNTVVQPGGLLLPLNSVSQPERTFVRGLTITFQPTPTYTAVRYFTYRAGHVLTSGTTYQYMTDEVANVVLVKAQAEALRLLSADTAGDGWKYSVGDFMVDKSGQGRSYGEIISKFDGEFDRLVLAMRGPAGVRATYTAAETAAF